MNVVFSGIGSAFVAAVVAVLGYSLQQRESRRVVRATMYAHALQSQINFHTAWLEVGAPTAVASAYSALVAAARQEAGPQMTTAWAALPTSDDAAVPLGVAYTRPQSDAALEKVKAAMMRHR